MSALPPARTAASAPTSRGWNCASRWKSSTAASPSTSRLPASRSPIPTTASVARSICPSYCGENGSMTDVLTEDEQQRRSQWFREHWQNGVAFNRRCGMRILRWDGDAVEIALPYADDLSAHSGIFHGGVVGALLDTTATAAVMAGHDFNRASRLTTISMSVQYLSVAPGEDLLCEGVCTRRGRT